MVGIFPRLIQHWKLTSLILIAIVWTFFQVNTSSIGSFCLFLPIGCAQETMLFENRTIRSDEWLVGTPYLITQVSNDLGYTNDLVGNLQSLPFLSVTKHWSNFFKPYLWPFNIIPSHYVSYAYSLYSLVNILSILVVGYLFLNFFIKSSLKSILLASSLFLTPFLQWWSAFTTVAGPLSLLLIAFWWFKLEQIDWKKVVGFSLAGVFLFSVNLYQLYPPFQIPLLLMIGFLFWGFLFDQKNINQKIIIGFLILAISIILGLLQMKLFFSEFSSVLETMQASSYPGQRISVGGNYYLFRFVSGFFDLQLLDNRKPMGPWNQSEAAGFINTFIFIWPVILLNEIYLRYKSKRNNFYILSIILYLFFIFGWMMIGYSPLIAKLTLLERVPANRALIAFGLASFLGSIYYVYNYKIVFPHQKIVLSLLTSLAFCIIAITGFYLRQNYPMYIGNIYKILIISISAGVIAASALFQRKNIFVILLFLFSLLTSLTIHPIRLGIKPIIDNKFIHQIKAINASQPGRWAVYENNLVSALIYANGLQSTTGIFLYPQPDFWQNFDPNNQNKEVWNRYAHVYYILPHKLPTQDINFALNGADSFSVEIDPCHKVLTELRVNYFVALRPLEVSCLEQIPSEGHSVFIYRRVTN